MQAPRVSLWAETAADLMTANPVSIRDDASIKEVLVLFTEKGFSAAPVIDRSGRPVGVISRFDLIVHDREMIDFVKQVPEYYTRSQLVTAAGEHLTGFQVERVDRSRVSDLMTPTIFAVRPDTPAVKVIDEMRHLKVHRLFVVDEDEVLIGVISALDILSHLRLDVS